MKKNWYGFDHVAVNKKFEGGLTYLNDLCVFDEYYPVAVYKVETPNRSKGHKDYLLLQVLNGQMLIRGMNENEMENWRYQSAIVCELCKDIVYSVNRHDMRSCECGENSIDGGKEYTKINSKDETSYTLGSIDIILDRFYLP
jgi:hypothetical protein